MNPSKLQRLSRRIARLQIEFMEAKAAYRSLEDGKHGVVTVYTTKTCKIRSHNRRGYVAVRVKK